MCSLAQLATVLAVKVPNPTPALDSADIAEAWALMLHWAESTRSIRRTPAEFSAAASLELNDALNDIVTRRAKSAFGWEPRHKPSREMVATMGPYLHRLVAAAQPILNWALEYRVVAAEMGCEWPAGTTFPDLRDPGFLATLAAARNHQDVRNVIQERLSAHFRANPVVPPPSGHPYGVSHAGAEQLCAEWMRHLGEHSAHVTRISQDGGIDIESTRFVAQVKNYVAPVGVDPIRSLVGVASIEQKRPLFFAAKDFTASAVDFADRARVALFVYDAVNGTLRGANPLGREARHSGLFHIQ